MAISNTISHFFNFSVISILNRILMFIYGVKLANAIGVEKTGIYNSLSVFISMAAIFSDLGLSSYLIQQIAKKKQKTNNIFSEIISLKIILSFIVIILSIFISKIYYDDLFYKLTIIFSITILLDSITISIQSVFQGMERFQYFYLTSFIITIITMFAGLYTVSITNNIKILVLIMVLCSFLKTAINILLLNKKFFKIRFKLSKDITSYFIKAIPFGFISVLGIIYFRIDMLMLKSISGNYETGIYSVAYKLINMLAMLASTFTTIFFPVLTRVFSINRELLPKIVSTSLKFMLIISLPLCIGTNILSKQIILWIFNKEFLNAYIPLSILIFATAFVFFNTVLYNIMYACEKQKYVMNIMLIAVILNVLMNYFMIPELGYKGASYSTVICEILIFFISLIILYNMSKNSIKITKVFKIIMCSVVMTLVVNFFSMKVHVIFSILAGIISYFIMIYIMFPFNKDEKDILNKIPVISTLFKWRLNV